MAKQQEPGGCAIAFLAGLIVVPVIAVHSWCTGGCVDERPLPAGCSVGGGREWAEWDEARNRRDALKERARREIGAQALRYEAAAGAAEAEAEAAYRAWQRCMRR